MTTRRLRASPPHAVSNATSPRFVEATGLRHRGRALRLVVRVRRAPARRLPRHARRRQAPWWRQVDGAAGAIPRGRSPTLEDRGDHPVVHVSWNDAVAYCAWAGDAAADRGRVGVRRARRARRAAVPVGRRARAGRRAPHERLAGRLPRATTRAADGFFGTAPVDAFPPNGFGLHNMTGNVWEWCADWFSRDFHTRDAHATRRGPRRARIARRAAARTSATRRTAVATGSPAATR